MKPVSASTKDWLVELTAKELELDEAICNKVISWAYLKAKEATADKNSIELSGFGKLLVTKGKLGRKIKNMKKYINALQTISLPAAESEEDKKEIITAIETALVKVETLKQKLPQYEF
jgi:nucleoid DNA-binding protein